MTDNNLQVISTGSDLQASRQSILNLHNFEQVWKFAQTVADTQLVPKHFHKDPAAILVAIEFGVELGVPPMQALQNIAVINGKPSIWGDLGMALIQSAPDLAKFESHWDADKKEATFTIGRQLRTGGMVEETGVFSMQDARVAGLATRDTYKNYPDQMCMWRAFWRAARRTYSDRLRGLVGAEEARDMHPEDFKRADVREISDGAAELNEALGKSVEKPEPKPEPESVVEAEPTKGKAKKVEPAPRGYLAECKAHLDMMNVEPDCWLGVAAEHITVPEKAEALEDLSEDSLELLEAALRRQMEGVS